MGAVYEARQVGLERRVAVKLLPPEWLFQEGRARQFTAEGRLLARLQHPQVVTVYSSGETVEGWRYLIMEYVEGGTLAELLQKGAVSLEEGCRLMEEIAAGVAAAHGLEICHRDLKPSNILLEGGQRVKVADFGLAALRGEGAGGRLGTRRYSAPEQWLGGAGSGLRADVYSLGVLACELLTGRLPGEEREGTALPGAEVPGPFGEVVRRALSADPARRQADAGVFLEEWNAAKNAAANRQKLRRARRLAAVLALLTLAAAAAGLFAWHQSREAQSARGLAEAALVKSRKTEAASLAAVASDSLRDGKAEEAQRLLAQALRLDQNNGLAGWMAGQALLDQKRFVRMAEVPFSTEQRVVEAQVPRGFPGGALVLRREDGVLHRCQIEPGKDGHAAVLKVGPWPEQAEGLPPCVEYEVSPDGKLVSVVYADGSLRVWELDSGALRLECGSVEGGEHFVHWAMSGHVMVQSSVTTVRNAAGQPESWRSVLRAVSVEDGRILFPPVTVPVSVNWGQYAVTADDRWLVSGCAYAVGLRITDMKDGMTRDVTSLWAAEGDGAGAAHSFMPLPGGAEMLVGGQRTGYRVLRLNAETGQAVGNDGGNVVLLQPARAYTVSLTSMKLAPDGRHLVASGSEGNAMRHELADLARPGVPLREGGHAQSVYFTGDEEVVLASEETEVWNWCTGERVARRERAMLVPCGDGWFVSRSDKHIALWRLAGRDPVRAELKLGTGTAALDIDAAGGRLLVAARDGAAELWDLRRMTRVGAPVAHHPPPHRNLRGVEPARRMISRPRLSANGEAFVVWRNEQALEVYRAGEVVAAFTRSANHRITCAALSPDGGMVAFAVFVPLQDARSGGDAAVNGSRWEVWSVPGGNLVGSGPLNLPPREEGSFGESGRAMCMEFSPDGQRLAIGTENWCTFSLYGGAGWEAIQKPHMLGHGAADICFVPQAGGAAWVADWLGHCRRYDDPPYTKEREPDYVATHAPVADIAISSDGQWLAAASWNRRAFIYDQHSLEPRNLELQHRGAVSAVDWSADGRRLLTATVEGEVGIWDRETGRKMFSWPQDSPVVQAVFAMNSSRIVIARRDGIVKVREVFDGGTLPSDAAQRLQELAGDSKK